MPAKNNKFNQVCKYMCTENYKLLRREIEEIVNKYKYTICFMGWNS